MSHSVKASIIVCTYNRSTDLSRLLNYLPKLEGIEQVEVIIVDNNSSDDTRQVCDAVKKDNKFLLRYIFEPRQGKTIALNTGLKETKGQILFFTDDDVLPDCNWIVDTLNTFDRYGADAVFGKIHPFWPDVPPKWLTKLFYSPLALLDYGDSEFVVENMKHEFYGANFAVTSKVIEDLSFKFDEKLGRVGLRLVSAEDTDFFMCLMRNNKKIVYNPKSKVTHYIAQKRLTKKYMLDWYFYSGIGMVLQNKHETRIRIALRALGDLIQFVVKSALLGLMLKANAFRCRVEVARQMGIIYECIFGRYSCR
jgi:glycosyltransferase involved in cell wall biosynthesis